MGYYITSIYRERDPQDSKNIYDFSSLFIDLEPHDFLNYRFFLDIFVIYHAIIFHHKHYIFTTILVT